MHTFSLLFFFFNDTATTEIYTLSLHDALPIFSYSTFTSFNASAFDEVGSFRVGAIFAPQNRGRVERAIREELERAAREGFGAQEIKAGKQALLEARRMARTQDRALANRLHSYLFLKRTFAWAIELESRLAALTPA